MSSYEAGAFGDAAVELLKRHEIARVADAFAEEGIDLLFFKGTALAYSLYAQPHLRPRLDNDILVRPDQERLAIQVLEALGYELYPQLEIFNEKCFVRTDDLGQAHVWDVHTRISNRSLAANLFSFDELWSRSLELPQLGRKARRVGDEDHLLLTALHVVCHHRGEWDATSARDGQLLLARLDRPRRESLVRLARQKKNGEVLRQFLAQVERFTGENVSEIDLLLGGKIGEPLGRWVERPPGVTRIFLSDLRHRAGVSAKLKFLTGLFFPTRAYRSFHGTTILRRLGRAFFLAVPGLRRLFSYHRSFRAFTGASSLGLALVSLLGTLSEGFGVSLFVAYLQGKTPLGPTLPHYYAVAVACVFLSVRAAVVVGNRAYHYNLHARLTARLIDALTQTLIHNSYEDYLRLSSGKCLQWINVEVPRAVNAFYQLSALVPSAVCGLTYVAMGCYVDTRLIAIVAAAGAFMALASRPLFSRMARLSEKVSAEESRLSSLAVQLLHAFKYLTATAEMPRVQAQLEAAARSLADLGGQVGRIFSTLPLVSDLGIIVVLGLVSYLHFEVWRGNAETLAVCLLFSYRAMRELTQFQNGWLSFQQHVGGVDSLFAQLAKRKDEKGNVGGKLRQLGEIELSEVSFGFSSKLLCERVSFRIAQGEMIGIEGDSGNGKTTLLDVLLGLHPAISGEVRLKGVDGCTLNTTEARAQIGYVTQDNILFDDTIANNISLWQWSQHPDGKSRVVEALESAGCASFVNALPLGLDTLVGERGMRFSGGERQRLAIARELYRKPRVLMLDEATNALDAETEKGILESLKKLKGQITLILVSHRTSTLQDCDRIFRFEKKRLVEKAPVVL